MAYVIKEKIEDILTCRLAGAVEGALADAVEEEEEEEKACPPLPPGVMIPADMGVSGQSVSPWRSGTDDTSSFRKSNLCSDWMHILL